MHLIAQARRHLLVDVTPLRTSRSFAVLWSSGLITYLGSMVTYVAVPFQVKDITGSYLAVGAVAAVELVALVGFGLFGGALADRWNRRTLLLSTELGLLVSSLVLLVNAVMPDPSLLVIYAGAFLSTSLAALQRPSMTALVPQLVPPDQLTAASALQSLRWNIGMIAGPAIGGLLIAGAGVQAAYLFDAASYVLSLLLLTRLAPVARVMTTEDAPAPLGAIAEGLRYSWSRKDLLGTYAVDMMAMVMAFPIAVFPFVADDYPDQPWLLGALYSAPAVGSLVATVTSGWTRRVHRHGRAIVCAAGVWGAAIAGFGLADSPKLLLACLVVAGAADMISGVFRSVVWDTTIPAHLRGRLAGIEMLSYATGPQLGQMRVTAMAQLSSIRVSLVAGGVLCIGGVALLAITMPALWKYDARHAHQHTRDSEDHSALPPASQ